MLHLWVKSSGFLTVSDIGLELNKQRNQVKESNRGDNVDFSFPSDSVCSHFSFVTLFTPCQRRLRIFHIRSCCISRFKYYHISLQNYICCYTDKDPKLPTSCFNINCTFAQRHVLQLNLNQKQLVFLVK